MRQCGNLASANDARQTYLRARLTPETGEIRVEPFSVQDSSMMRGCAQADALIARAPHAPSAAPGDRTDIIPLDGH